MIEFHFCLQVGTTYVFALLKRHCPSVVDLILDSDPDMSPDIRQEIHLIQAVAPDVYKPNNYIQKHSKSESKMLILFV